MTETRWPRGRLLWAHVALCDPASLASSPPPSASGLQAPTGLLPASSLGPPLPALRPLGDMVAVKSRPPLDGLRPLGLHAPGSRALTTARGHPTGSVLRTEPKPVTSCQCPQHSRDSLVETQGQGHLPQTDLVCPAWWPAHSHCRGGPGFAAKGGAWAWPPQRPLQAGSSPQPRHPLRVCPCAAAGAGSPPPRAAHPTQGSLLTQVSGPWGPRGHAPG